MTGDIKNPYDKGMGLSTENEQQIYRSRGKMMMDNFLGGMMWSLGTLVGGAIILIVVGIFISKIDFVPIIGNWTHNILQETLKNQPIQKIK